MRKRTIRRLVFTLAAALAVLVIVLRFVPDGDYTTSPVGPSGLALQLRFPNDLQVNQQLGRQFKQAGMIELEPRPTNPVLAWTDANVRHLSADPIPFRITVMIRLNGSSQEDQGIVFANTMQLRFGNRILSQSPLGSVVCQDFSNKPGMPVVDARQLSIVPPPSIEDPPRDLTITWLGTPNQREKAVRSLNDIVARSRWVHEPKEQ